MTQRWYDGYDIIGDIHGCADELDALLTSMGYRQDDAEAPYRHHTRQAVFAGDLIDRGPGQLRVLQIVKAMTDAGSALMVLGNHEFNALAYDTEWPTGSGKYLRPHDDPGNKVAEKNEKQHREFLAQVGDSQRADYLKWLWTQPLWLDLGDIRIVHACWHQRSIDYLVTELGGNRLRDIDDLRRASNPGDEVYEAVETILKGPEISLIDHGQPAYRDKGGVSRANARLRWWYDGPSTLRDLAEMGAGYKTADGDPYPALPDTPISVSGSYLYEDRIPVFYGHYWRRGTPARDRDWTEFTACVDFSAINGEKLSAYRWSGEHQIDPDNYCFVDAHRAGT